MISVTLDSVAQLALANPPDWSQGMVTTFRFEVDTVRAISGRQERRPLGASLRVRMDYSLLLAPAAASALRNALRTIQDTPVRVPFWPALDRGSTPWSSRWWMDYDAGSSLGSVIDVSWSQTPQRVPTLRGHLTEAPALSGPHTELVGCRVQFVESSPIAEALSVASESWTSGPTVAGVARYLFPLRPNWRDLQTHGDVRIDVRRQWMGFARESGSEAYPQVGSRQPRFGFTLDHAEAARLVRWFSDRRGTVEPFWVPGYLSETRLASNTSAGSAQITLTDATPLAPFSYIALMDGDGAIVTRKIESRVGNTLTLSSSPGTLSAASTLLCSLALVRHAGAELTLRWMSPDIAETEIAFVEVAEEYASPVGDEIQTTQGDLGPRAQVYILAYGASEVLRWTTWDQGVTAPGGAYSDAYSDAFGGDIGYDAAAGIAGSITEGSVWDRTAVTFRCRTRSDNPLLRLIRGTASERITLTILEVTPGAVGVEWTNEETIFHGVITQASVDGAFIEATADSFGRTFGVRIPRMLMQTGDNWELFGEGNDLRREEWTFAARLTAVSGTTLTFDSFTWPQGSLPTIAAHYFAGGYVERPAGSSFERIPIASSTAMSGGALQVTIVNLLASSPTTPETGWSLVPGYDGQYETLDQKFGASEDFGGFPEIPATNPTIVPRKKDTTTAGKK